MVDPKVPASQRGIIKVGQSHFRSAVRQQRSCHGTGTDLPCPSTIFSNAALADRDGVSFGAEGRAGCEEGGGGNLTQSQTWLKKLSSRGRLAFNNRAHP